MRKFKNGARVRGKEDGPGSRGSFRGRAGTVLNYVRGSGYDVLFDDGVTENVPSYWLEAA